MAPTEWPPKPIAQNAVRDARALLAQQKTSRQEKKRIRDFYKDEQRAMRREDDDVAMRRADLDIRRKKQEQAEQRAAMRWAGAKTTFQRSTFRSREQANEVARRIVERHQDGELALK